MTKVRDDFEGVVYIDGKAYGAGDEIPEGVEVGDHLLPEEGKKDAAAKDAGPSKPSSSK
jgi:hypothetical protein